MTEGCVLLPGSVLRSLRDRFAASHGACGGQMLSWMDSEVGLLLACFGPPPMRTSIRVPESQGSQLSWHTALAGRALAGGASNRGQGLHGGSRTGFRGNQGRLESTFRHPFGSKNRKRRKSARDEIRGLGSLIRIIK